MMLLIEISHLINVISACDVGRYDDPPTQTLLLMVFNCELVEFNRKLGI